MWAFLQPKFAWIIGTFHNNETLVWSRVQMAIGAAWMALSAADLTPLHLDPKYMMGWMMFNGFISEMLRRNREEFKDDDHKDH
jgi:hypothetical protein